MSHSSNEIPVQDNMQTIGFYNLENLFDLSNDPNTNDDDFLPMSSKRWTPKRYQNKLRKLGFAISNIGRQETGKHPALVGLAEVENAKVIRDLLSSEYLEEYRYDYIHFDSLDERGIDVALIYDTDAFKVLHTETFGVLLTDEDGAPDFTRDILRVSGLLDNEKIHLIVNHWSSRREGAEETSPKRMASAEKVGYIISQIRDTEPKAKILVLGDYNDEPQSESIQYIVNNCQLYNPMETLKSYKRGSVNFKRQWFLFDQILLSTTFFKPSQTEFEFSKAEIFDEDFLKLFNGPFKGSPFRTYVGSKYKGGYSDHFPVYAILKK
ncbi:endonuclease/exonuclease/phosphatase family protein [Gaetbulibacter aestuarii]|uniref:Endonuclease n=1 Tax=Gaetbulibacter aestuarii TaxID=1502358 RepID=A0ABW7MW24_9FLAO